MGWMDHSPLSSHVTWMGTTRHRSSRRCAECLARGCGCAGVGSREVRRCCGGCFVGGFWGDRRIWWDPQIHWIILDSMISFPLVLIKGEIPSGNPTWLEMDNRHHLPHLVTWLSQLETSFGSWSSQLAAFDYQSACLNRFKPCTVFLTLTLV